MQAIQITVDIQNGYLRSTEKGLDLRVADGVLHLALHYDFGNLPLKRSPQMAPLTEATMEMTVNVAECKTAEIRILPYRIDIFADGRLVDEEWPAGQCCFAPGNAVESDLRYSVREIAYTEPEQPAVLGTFEDPENWFPGENVFVGDCMPYAADGVYHVIYLKDRHHHQSKWQKGAHQWSHVSTEDFKTWSIHPDVVPITDPAEASICTGSWIWKDDLQYMFYTVRTFNFTPAPIRRSVSADGYHYKKDSDFGFTLSEKYLGAAARDPKVIRDSNGRYHMFLTTAIVAENRGCLAHLSSEDLDNWQEEDPIYIAPDASHPECPDYIAYGGYYYLIFSHGGKGQYLYAKEPFGPWQTPTDPHIPCDSVPKGAVWQDKIVFSGFTSTNGRYAGKLKFRTAHTNENGELVFA